ncbi:MAG: Clp protease N-terminal domain-containing protein, partial [Sarcina sp.]
MEVTRVVGEILVSSYKLAKENGDEYITPEHFLYSILSIKEFKEILEKHKVNINEIKANIKNYIESFVDKIENHEPEESMSTKNMLYIAAQQAIYSGKKVVDLEHLIAALFQLESSYAVYYLEEQGITKRDILFHICHNNIE